MVSTQKLRCRIIRTVVIERPKPPFASPCLDRLDIVVDPWIWDGAALMGDLKSLQKRHIRQNQVNGSRAHTEQPGQLVLRFSIYIIWKTQAMSTTKLITMTDNASLSFILYPR